MIAGSFNNDYCYCLYKHATDFNYCHKCGGMINVVYCIEKTSEPKEENIIDELYHPKELELLSSFAKHKKTITKNIAQKTLKTHRRMHKKMKPVVRSRLK